jgi:hypothetical protein
VRALAHSYCDHHAAILEKGSSKGHKSKYDARTKAAPLKNAPNGEYEAKAKKSDEAFGAPGSTAVLGALRAIPTVRGIALGAFGEFSESINVLIQGLAHEGALKNPDEFGQSNYKAAYGQIHWWLKR